ncbi:exodeoxyribonuclease VII large subunit [Aeromicrobium sp. 636]|uniref:Exodeoxyribonuclease 7 large subunit n=1 Tax=Aeromicrobium senzhongii TaxID=2663859 RepID=A0A8I0ETH0_9ACTN|nr:MULTISPECIES: exodeoxyribonuclease VII large subunit [Aeromicrobium]MBC9225885.1 exodeoxyribonuclease VII large subunit [Aeromicrobium senzhongii]MCQ3997992.1 exodeoxyribonuclease VII large subunit [Aeromicrobium sp. 636]
MALETSADSPAPLRSISLALQGWIGKLGAVWVEAEVVQPKLSGNTYYLTLRDLAATMSISAIAFRAVVESSASPITDGTRVIVHAKPEFYSPNGRLSLKLLEIRPTGEGELLAQLERRRQLLAAEGLFEARWKRPLPVLPTAIGLVTGKGSAAERDVIQNVRDRWPGATLEVRHALMQGSQSATAVIAALRELDAAAHVDVIVIARGGGALEDLLPFSDEALVRAVYAATTPVVSAIGHEPDVPLLDLVADLRASTPTDAAKRVVPHVGDELAGLAAARERARQAVAAQVHRELAGLAALRSRPVLRSPSAFVDSQQDLVMAQRERARRAMRSRLDRAHDEIGHHLARVRALSPLATMRRGYAVALDPAGHAVTSIEPLAAGDELVLHLTDGRATVRVTELQEHPHE